MCAAIGAFSLLQSPLDFHSLNIAYDYAKDNTLGLKNEHYMIKVGEIQVRVFLWACHAKLGSP